MYVCNCMYACKHLKKSSVYVSMLYTRQHLGTYTPVHILYLFVYVINAVEIYQVFVYLPVYVDEINLNLYHRKGCSIILKKDTICQIILSLKNAITPEGIMVHTVNKTQH